MYADVRRLAEDTRPQFWEIRCCRCGDTAAVMESTEMLGFVVWLSKQPEAVMCFDCEDRLAREIRLSSSTYLKKAADGLQRLVDINGGGE